MRRQYALFEDGFRALAPFVHKHQCQNVGASIATFGENSFGIPLRELLPTDNDDEGVITRAVFFGKYIITLRA